MSILCQYKSHQCHDIVCVIRLKTCYTVDRHLPRTDKIVLKYSMLAKNLSSLTGGLLFVETHKIPMYIKTLFFAK